jgi:hypothetical protein
MGRRARRSPVLVQRAVSEDPRWTRAVGDPLARPQGENKRGCRLDARRSLDVLAGITFVLLRPFRALFLIGQWSFCLRLVG